MRRVLGPVFLVLGVVVSFLTASCSGSDGSGSKAGAESIYDPGAPVPARGFDDSSTVELLWYNPDTAQYVPVQEGQYLEPGKHRLAVRIQGNAGDIDRVLVSNGGLYQVEASFQQGMYLCDFAVKADRLTVPILVQAIHTDGRASKAKYVVRTAAEGIADSLIINGAGCTVADEIMDASGDEVADLIDTVVDAVTSCLGQKDGGLLSRFSHGGVVVNLVESADDPSHPQGVIHLNLTIKNVDLSAVDIYGQDLISTTGNDMTIDACVAISDIRSDGSRGLVLDLGNTPVVHFSKDFFLRGPVEDMIAASLRRIEVGAPAADLASIVDLVKDKMPLTITLGDTVVDVQELLDRLDLDLTSRLYIDMKGMPEETGFGSLSMTAGIYAGDSSGQGGGSGGTSAGSIDVEGVFMDMFTSIVDTAFEATRKKYDGIVTTLAYGDADPATSDIDIETFAFQGAGTPTSRTLRVRFVINDVDFNAFSLFGFSLIHTSNNDLTVDAAVRLTHSRTGVQDTVLVEVSDVYEVNFDDTFLGDFVVEEILAQDIKDLDPFALDVDAMVDDVVPPDYLTACADFGSLFPDVGAIESPYLWGLGLQGDATLGVVITQDTINNLLSRIFVPGFEWNVYEILRPLLGDDFAGFQQNRKPGEETILSLSVPPMIDMRANRIRMQLDGVRILYRLDGDPVWEASVDLDLILDVKVQGNELAFYLTTAQENCHFHIMKDNPGNLGVFDHSNLVNDVVEKLPRLLGKQDGSPLFTVGLDEFEPYLELDDTQNPIVVTASGGCLYIEAAARSVDMGWMKDLFLDL